MKMHGERWQVPAVLLKVFEDLFDRTRQVVACHSAVELGTSRRGH